MKFNPILLTDSYKLSHFKQMPTGSTTLYSHLTPRNNKYLKQKFPTMENKYIAFGSSALVQILSDTWDECFFKRPWEEVKEEALKDLTPFIGLVETNLERFKDLHKLGYLPLNIKSLPEGSHVALNIPMLTIRNTHPDFYWLTNFIEPYILNSIYKPVTVATLSLELARLRDYWFDKTVVDQSGKDFALHDFSYRGQASTESAAFSIAAYLLYTKGTDTMPAISFAKKYYKAEDDVAGSIPAFEHSTATLGIQYYKNVANLSAQEIASQFVGLPFSVIVLAKEAVDELVDLYKDVLSPEALELAVGETFNLAITLLHTYPTGLFAYVADSYDFYFLVEGILPVLKKIILARDGKIVIRPDSGNPVHVTAGYHTKTLDANVPNWNTEVLAGELELAYKEGFYAIRFKEGDTYFKILKNGSSYSAQPLSRVKAKGLVETLWNIFGGATNDKGYRVLDSHVGVVYGDGMNYSRIENIYKGLSAKNFAASNVVLSGGAFLLSAITRDDLGFAIKGSLAVVNDVEYPIYKKPITDSSKASPKGYFKVTKDEKGNFTLHENVTKEEEKEGELKTIFFDGFLVEPTTFKEIQKRLPL